MCRNFFIELNHTCKIIFLMIHFRKYFVSLIFVTLHNCETLNHENFLIYGIWTFPHRKICIKTFFIFQTLVIYLQTLILYSGIKIILCMYFSWFVATTIFSPTKLFQIYTDTGLWTWPWYWIHCLSLASLTLNINKEHMPASILCKFP